jgi:hypothetical protein
MSILKKTSGFLPCSALAVSLVTSHAQAADLAADLAAEQQSEFYRAMISDAMMTLHLRTYLLDRTDTSSSDPAAWAGGGWIGYESDWIGATVKVGVVGYTSLELWGPEDRDGSLLLKPGPESYAVLGQAYASLKYEEQVMTFYRQLVNQPEVNPQDSRMTPNTFEAVSLKGDLGVVNYYAGLLANMKKRNSDEFVNMAEAAGVTNEDSYLWLGGLEIDPAENLKMRASLYVVPDLLASSYADAAWTTPIGDDASLRLSGQFMYQGGVGSDLLMGCNCDTWVGGAKADLIFGGLTLTGGYTQTSEEFDYQAPYGSWPGYTGLIVKDFDRAGEKAVLAGFAYDFADLGAEGLVFNSLAAWDLDVNNPDPEFNEYDFTLDYRLSALEGDWEWLAPLWLRARYAHVDIGGDDDNLDDFRVIVNYEWQFKGKDL